MDKILDGVSEIFDRMNSFALATCGGCGHQQLAKERARLEPGLAQVFAIQPLPDLGDGEAARATQRGAKLLHEGRVDEALKELFEAKRCAPSSQVARSNLGCAYFERGDEDAALHWYHEAHRLAPHNALATQALAYLEQRAGHIADSQWLLMNFLQEVDSSHVGALRQLARLQQLQGQWAQAANTYRRLMAVEPNRDEWPNQLQRCLENTGVAPLDSVVDPLGASEPVGGVLDQLEEAHKLRESGHPVAALAAYKALQRSSATSTDALLGIVDCHSDLGNHDKAVAAAKQLLCLKPDDPEGNLRMAELMLSLGQPAYAAEPYLKRSMGVRDDKHLKHRLLCVTAEVALGKEDFKQALSSASEAVRMDASVPKGLIILGTARLQVAEYAGALRALTAALDATTGRQDAVSKRCRAQAYTLSAQSHERQRQFPQAIEQAQRALDLNPQLEAAHVVRASALQQSGRTREAALELEAVLQHSPQHAPALLQLGYLQLCAGDARAVSTLEVAAFGTSAAGSMLGAAKVYLALSLDLNPERCTRGRPEQVLKEGLAAHRNLQCVWQEIEQGLGVRQPLAAVQKLRGICDLDLTSAQARQLLGLLANAMGRVDLARAVANLARPESAQRGGDGRGSRPPSVQPQRWAPLNGMDSTQQRVGGGRASSRDARGSLQDTGPGRGSFRIGVTPDGSRCGTPYRGRSVSPVNTSMYYGPH